jgi:hypothetical protein
MNKDLLLVLAPLENGWLNKGMAITYFVVFSADFDGNRQEYNSSFGQILSMDSISRLFESGQYAPADCARRGHIRFPISFAEQGSQPDLFSVSRSTLKKGICDQEVNSMIYTAHPGT